jgi:hypothetical protein
MDDLVTIDLTDSDNESVPDEEMELQELVNADYFEVDNLLWETETVEELGDLQESSSNIVSANIVKNVEASVLDDKNVGNKDISKGQVANVLTVVKHSPTVANRKRKRADPMTNVGIVEQNVEKLLMEETDKELLLLYHLRAYANNFDADFVNTYNHSNCLVGKESYTLVEITFYDRKSYNRHVMDRNYVFGDKPIFKRVCLERSLDVLKLLKKQFGSAKTTV